MPQYKKVPCINEKVFIESSACCGFDLKSWYDTLYHASCFPSTSHFFFCLIATDCSLFLQIFWLITAISTNPDKLSSLYLLAYTITDITDFTSPLKRVLLDDHGRRLSWLPWPLGHPVELRLGQIFIASFLKL